MPVSPEFRASVRIWLEENCPAEMRTPMPMEEAVWGGRKEAFIAPKSRRWLQAVAARGWLAPAWPEKYGGAGLGADEAKCIEEEMQSMGCRPPLMSLGIHMMGPTIMEFGSEEQKLEHLPKIARGQIRWCQGYSEPGAGSDLASLQCRAVPDGDEYVVNGQKVWTSFADKSDFIFCLVRTDFSARKHHGISVLLIDMAFPGVSTRPIELISGSSHFCEVFFDEVRVNKKNLLGELNKGWPIAKRMLEYERNMMGGGTLSKQYNPDLVDLAKRYIGVSNGKLADGELRPAIANNDMRMHLVNVTASRVMAEVKAGEGGGAAAILKYAMSLACQDKFELLIAIMGHKGLGWDTGQGFSPEEVAASRDWAFSKIQTIGGGTSEIQLNIIAKYLLGLPE